MRSLYIILISLLISSCATQKLKIKNEFKGFANIKPQSELLHSLYLIGDAGLVHNGESAPALKYLKETLQNETVNSAVVFLGDNIYPDGMPEKEEGDLRTAAEDALMAQVNAVKDFSGKAYFVPGNHDWRAGVGGIRRQERFIEDSLGTKKAFRPSDACSGPEVVELGEDAAIIFIDSQWWMENWDKHPKINGKCESKTRDNFIFNLSDVLKKNKEKTVILAMHHPIATYGPHGGRFSADKHIFPLRWVDKGLLIPIPLLGTFIRKYAGIPQDVNHPSYNEFIRNIHTLTADYKNVIFAGGHEHTQQLIKDGDKFQIVSGAGSKSNPVALGPDALFVSGNQGFSKIEIYKDNSVWVSFYDVGKSGDQWQMVFRNKLFTKESIYPVDPSFDFTEFESGSTSRKTSIYDVERDKSGFYKSVFGKHYRDLYSVKSDVPILDLSKIKGGLTPLKRGGGYQTNSLRLEDNEKRHWVLRALKKDATKLVPSAFRETFAFDFIDDQFNTAHPYAAFGIAPMAEAIGILHTKPKLYYVPKQPVLGKFNEFFGNELYLFEERPADDRSDLENLGFSKEVVSSGDLIENIRKSYKHRTDGPALARARLFDILIGDWDRHEDQWRWATFKEDGKTIYRPIPRDRDQAFVKFDGLAYSILNKTMPVFQQWQKYDHSIKNVPGINFNGKYVDRTFMTDVDWPSMEREAKHIQSTLTDEVIEESISQWPKEIYEKNGADIIAKIKSRRDKLDKYARDFYRFVAKSVDVVGTDDRDHFKVSRLDDNRVMVQVYDLSKKGNIKELYYERIFVRGDTKEIILYGLRDDDQFLIGGDVNKSILVRAVGGLGNDEFLDESKVKGGSKRTKFYDDKRKNKFDAGSEAKVIQSDRRAVNLYNRKDFLPDYSFPFPLFSFNSDDGILLGGFYQSVKQGFKKDPYKSAQTIGAFFSPTTGGYDINYKGDFSMVFGSWDFLLEGEFQGLQSVRNFYGFGNDTEKIETDTDFYRVRNSHSKVKPNFKKRLIEDIGVLKIGPFWENINVEQSSERFITSPEAAIPEGSFETKNYGGIELEFELNNIDVLHNPSRGIRLFVNSGFTMDMSDTGTSFGSFGTGLTFYQPLVGNRRLIFAQRVGYEVNLGDDYQFFQAKTLGSSNMRGLTAQRYAGKRVFYHNTELRLKLGEMNSYFLPNNFGISAGIDGGRVWMDDNDSDTWHVSYGGGIWFSPFDIFTLSANYYLTNNDESTISILMRTFF
jgi:hypothetical protein